MPAPIMADLRAAKAVMFAERVEPDGRAFVWESTAWRNRASGET